MPPASFNALAGVVFDAWRHKSKRCVWAQGKAQTAAIAVAIAKICNAAMRQKARFYVPHSVEHRTIFHSTHFHSIHLKDKNDSTHRKFHQQVRENQ
jgi:hypothetical protein